MSSCLNNKSSRSVILSKKTIKYEANNNHDTIVHISLFLCK